MACALVPEQIDTLLACLDDEIDEISAFIDLLEKEAEILIESESLDDIPALAQAKEASAYRLTTLAAEREQSLRALGGTGERDQMEGLAASDDALWQAWQTLLDVADQARSLNLRNGALIDIHLRHTQQALEGLRNALGISNLYTADGKAKSLNRSISISVG